jgi:uncharacterized protein
MNSIKTLNVLKSVRQQIRFQGKPMIVSGFSNNSITTMANQPVIHDEKNQKFKIELPEGEAFLAYSVKSSTIDLKHTEVPTSLRGRGLGKLLAEEALRYADKHGYKVKATCDFAHGYIQKQTKS